jgi:hypothetical protein
MKEILFIDSDSAEKCSEVGKFVPSEDEKTDSQERVAKIRNADNSQPVLVPQEEAPVQP